MSVTGAHLVPAPDVVKNALASPGKELTVPMGTAAARVRHPSLLRPSRVPPAGPLRIAGSDEAEEEAAERYASRASGSPMDAVPADAEGSVPGRGGETSSVVSVHTGPDAERSAKLIGAEAYAIPGHIVFGAGAYDPLSSRGRRLLAHEMSHALAAPGAAAVVRRATVHSDKDLFDIMEKFRRSNKQLTTEQQNKIFWSIKGATDSDEVAYAFFDYYSGWTGHNILLMSPAEETNAKAKDLYAETPSSGDTKIRSDVLTMDNKQLGPLLLHEFAHTGHHTNYMGSYDFEEGQAYGVEYFYAEHTGDTARMAKIVNIISNAAARWGATQEAATKENFRVTYALMKALADLTKTGSSSLPPLTGKSGDDGRLMSAAFVGNFADMPSDVKALWDYIKAHIASFTYPPV